MFPCWVAAGEVLHAASHDRETHGQGQVIHDENMAGVCFFFFFFQYRLVW